MSYVDIVICIGSLPFLETWPPIYWGQEGTVRDRLKASQVLHPRLLSITPCLTSFTFEFIRRPISPILTPSCRTFVELTLVRRVSTFRKKQVRAEVSNTLKKLQFWPYFSFQNDLIPLTQTPWSISYFIIFRNWSIMRILQKNGAPKRGLTCLCELIRIFQKNIYILAQLAKTWNISLCSYNTYFLAERDLIVMKDNCIGISICSTIAAALREVFRQLGRK
jgi:hypothetical protein